MIGYDRHSETERVLVNYEGLTIRSLLKIQSGPLGNLRDIHGDEFTHATGCGCRSRVAKFGGGAISDNKSGKQQADYWNFPGFHVGFVSFFEREYTFYGKTSDEPAYDVSESRRVVIQR